MKFTGIYLVGFLVPLCGILAVLAAFLKLGILVSVSAAWIIIGVVMLVGIGITIAMSHSGIREYIDISPS